ncbi:N-acetyltransferase [Angustibacter aerolatus]|uniref:N-acetyltransferase n=1 Tax=Angustibacter aerolatus TaxID=1162965 RepID=A0ABQ6JD02_9ACTN|nr:GNAT family N-acetyltransferase [Angustibacter aerolatus]GMA86066.1 N-acetyltransferase [Angustibacter aerolatus]
MQRAAFVGEALLQGTPVLPPLTEPLDSVRAAVASPDVVVLAALDERPGGGERVVGSVRVRVENGTGHVGRIAVAPDQQGRGVGSRLLEAAHDAVDVERFELFTGAVSASNLAWYERRGYQRVREGHDEHGIDVVVMQRPAGYQPPTARPTA